jgi:hypothetical protein
MALEVDVKAGRHPGLEDIEQEYAVASVDAASFFRVVVIVTAPVPVMTMIPPSSSQTLAISTINPTTAIGIAVSKLMAIGCTRRATPSCCR